MELLDLEELEDLRDVLESGGAHVRHSTSALDALLYRDEVGLRLLGPHGVLHLGEALLYLPFSLVEGLEEEDLLLCERLGLLLEVLLPEHQDVVLLLDDLVLVFEFLDLLVQLTDFLVVHLLQGGDLLLERLELLVPEGLLLLFFPPEPRKF